MASLRKTLERNLAKAAKSARRIQKEAIKMLKAHGASYSRIEQELDMRRGNGMNAWRKFGNKHPQTDRRLSFRTRGRSRINFVVKGNLTLK